MSAQDHSCGSRPSDGGPGQRRASHPLVATDAVQYWANHPSPPSASASYPEVRQNRGSFDASWSQGSPTYLPMMPPAHHFQREDSNIQYNQGEFEVYGARLQRFTWPSTQVQHDPTYGTSSYYHESNGLDDAGPLLTNPGLSNSASPPYADMAAQPAHVFSTTPLNTHVAPQPQYQLCGDSTQPRADLQLQVQTHDIQAAPSADAVSPSPSPSPTRTERYRPRVSTAAVRTASARRRTGTAPFTCPLPDCGSTFTSKVNLDGHMRSHNNEKPYTCEHCYAGFARKADLRRHIKSKHPTPGTPKFACASCDKEYARRDALDQHVQRKHQGDAADAGL